MGGNKITQKELKELLNYDPETGLFTWKVSRKRNQVKVGSVAGHKNKILGYIEIRLNKSHYYAHRLAWFYIYGEWPKNVIDHINWDRSDNSISNLRDIPLSENVKHRKPMNV